MTNYPKPRLSLFDIGANLTHSSFDEDREDVLLRAVAAGIDTIIITGTNLTESQEAANIASKHPYQLFSTAGIHPHDASDFTPSSIDSISSLAALPQVKAIGECGLDFNRMFSTKEQQIEAFEKQIELAIELKMPLFLHERDAHQTQWEILTQYRNKISQAVIHCFTGDREQAFRYLDLDLHLGITGWICDERRGFNLHEFVGDIPLDRLMIESDSPYLLPRIKPKIKLKSSRRNEPCTLTYVLTEIAKHRVESIDEIAIRTTQNAIDFFEINKKPD